MNYLFRYLYWKNSIRSGIEFSCRLGGGVIMPHFGPIKINATSIGENLYVFHGVTIGHDYRRGKPTIGNNVFIGANSLVLGEVRIGDNVVIGASSLVSTDVPSNSLVAGTPARIIKQIDDRYIEDMIGY